MTNESLSRVLGGSVPDVVAALDEQQQEALARLVGRARDDQSRALDEAIEGGLDHIPRPLRGVVRKALFR